MATGLPAIEESREQLQTLLRTRAASTSVLFLIEMSEQQTIQQGEEYVNTQISEMTDEGLKFDRNTLLKFMVDFQKDYGAGALLDSEGNYDFRKSLTLMEKMQPKEPDPSVAVKKQLASQGSRGKAATQRAPGVPVLSRNALRRGNWRDAEN